MLGYIKECGETVWSIGGLKSEINHYYPELTKTELKLAEQAYDAIDNSYLEYMHNPYHVEWVEVSMKLINADLNSAK